MSLTAQTYWAEHAWLDGAVERGVVIVTRSDGRIAAVRTGASGPPVGGVELRGLTIPGLANAHSHAFHRALRGTVQGAAAGPARGGEDGRDTSAPGPGAPAGGVYAGGAADGGAKAVGPEAGPGAGGQGSGAPGPGAPGLLGPGPVPVGGRRAPGSFWAWRQVMYAVADALTPESYFALARAAYAEMAMAGITCVGEFHYLHHPPGGGRYDDPNTMGKALIAAAAAAGIRITLLDTCYLSSGFGAAPDRHQLRFSDGTADAWAERADALRGDGNTRVGAAVHSVRAVPADQLATVAAWAARRSAPLHVHLSEQTAENDACVEAHGFTPARLLADHGVLGERTTAVHATHLTPGDIRLLGESATGVCVCPTTERDLADGIGPAAELRRAGSALCLGSDSHAVVDLLEEARALELDERLRTRARGHWTAAELLHAATAAGHAALGWGDDAGRIAPGALADFTTVALDSVRTAGPPPGLEVETAVFAATSADVRHTVVGGRHVVRDGRHQLVPRVPEALAEAVAAVRGA
ncbi:formimidoylglutamate deiminase [Streptomyces sp. B1866]|uniref:formimidoylglutamate deiminase n=1 Tax=Streptomyces sp. B1866 TaxID=3075431 RepID=UPI00288E2ED0|nr:formimidoylglutamate deiminase [Streptomyces sp. B1866]MDT3395846.1 formimidoylglutamate deiminase [Streptomyces sp. B1866]